MKTFILHMHKRLGRMPIKDPVERRMASLVQNILLGFIAIILIAALLNLILAPQISWQVNLFRSFIVILIIGFPLMLLRRGYFRSSVLIVIAQFFTVETFVVTTIGLRKVADT